MSTQPTNLPVPSESPRDLKFNAGKIDEYVTSMGWTYTDRFGQKHYTIEGNNYLAQQAMAAFGYVILTGKTFTTGATINQPNEVLLNTADGEYYKWTGSFASGPKVVPANSTPASTGGIGPGAWIGVGDASLRAALASSTGGNLVGLKKTGLPNNLATTVGAYYQTTSINAVTDYGMKGDFDPTTGVSNGANNVTPMQNMINDVIMNGGNADILIPSGKYRFKRLNTSNPGGVAVTLGIEGNGLKNVTIRGSGFSTELYCDDIGRLFGLFAADNVVIRDMKVIGYGGGSPSTTRERDQGFALGYNCKNVTFDKVYIDNFYGDCIYFGGDLSNGSVTGKQSRDVTVRNCILKERYGNGIRSLDSSGTGTRSRLALAIIDIVGIKIHDNLIYGEIDLEPNSTGQNMQYVEVTNNTFRTAGVTAVSNPYLCEPLYTGTTTIRGGVTLQTVAASLTSAAIVIKDNLIEYGRIRITGGSSEGRVLCANNRLRRGGIFIGHYSGTNNNPGIIVHGNQVDGAFTGLDDGNMEDWISGAVPSVAYFIQGSLTNCRIVDNYCGSFDAGFNSMFYLLNTTQTGGVDLTATGGRNVFSGNFAINTITLRNYSLRSTDLDICNSAMPSSGFARVGITKQISNVIINPVVDVNISGPDAFIDFAAAPSNKYRISHSASSAISKITGYSEETGMTIQLRSASASPTNTLTLSNGSNFYLQGGLSVVIDSPRKVITMQMIEPTVWTEVGRNF